jgi:hypothetical protein
MMSDRERWIVYPMLTLSLALGAKTRWDAFRGRSDFHVVTCRTLVVRNELDEQQIVLQQNSHGEAEVSLVGEKGIEAWLTAGEGGGRLMLVRRGDQRAILLGHDKLEEISGLWAIDAERADEGPVPLAAGAADANAWELLPWPIAAEEEEPKTEKDTPAKGVEKENAR